MFVSKYLWLLIPSSLFPSRILLRLRSVSCVFVLVDSPHFCFPGCPLWLACLLSLGANLQDHNLCFLRIFIFVWLFSYHSFFCLWILSFDLPWRFLCSSWAEVTCRFHSLFPWFGTGRLHPVDRLLSFFLLFDQDTKLVPQFCFALTSQFLPLPYSYCYMAPWIPLLFRRSIHQIIYLVGVRGFSFICAAASLFCVFSPAAQNPVAALSLLSAEFLPHDLLHQEHLQETLQKCGTGSKNPFKGSRNLAVSTSHDPSVCHAWKTHPWVSQLLSSVLYAFLK